MEVERLEFESFRENNPAKVSFVEIIRKTSTDVFINLKLSKNTLIL